MDTHRYSSACTQHHERGRQGRRTASVSVFVLGLPNLGFRMTELENKTYACDTAVVVNNVTETEDG